MVPQDKAVSLHEVIQTDPRAHFQLPIQPESEGKGLSCKEGFHTQTWSNHADSSWKNAKSEKSGLKNMAISAEHLKRHKYHIWGPQTVKRFLVFPA